MPRKQVKVSKEQRAHILNLVKAMQFQEASDYSVSLGLRPDYPNYLANVMGIHIRDLTGNLGIKGRPIFPNGHR